jgi:RNA polymerase sigma factor (sigma-70 family)
MLWYDTIKSNFESKINNAVESDISGFVKGGSTQSERDARATMVNTVLRPRLADMIDDEFEKVISRAIPYVDAGANAADKAARIRAVLPKAQTALDNYAQSIITLVRTNIEEKNRESAQQGEVSLTSNQYDDYVTQAVDYLIENGTDLSEFEDMDFVIDFTSHIEDFLQSNGVAKARAQSMASGILDAATERYREELLSAAPPAAAPATISQATPPPRPMVAAPAVTSPPPPKTPTPVKTVKAADDIAAAILGADFEEINDDPKQTSVDQQLINTIIQNGMKSRAGQAAFNEIYNKYNRYVVKFIASYVNQYKDKYPELLTQIEDVAQTTFLKMLTRLETFAESKSSFRTWIGTIARNSTIDLIRKYTSVSRVTVSSLEQGSTGDEQVLTKTRKTVYGQRHASIEAAEEDDSSVFASTASQRTAYDEVLQQVLTEKIDKILETLVGNQRECYRLYTVPDPVLKRSLKYEEISKRTGIPMNTVSTSIFRAKKAITRAIENDPEVADIYREMQSRKPNPGPAHDLTEDEFYDQHIVPVLIELFRREDAEYEQSPSSLALRNRIMGQIEQYSSDEEMVGNAINRFSRNEQAEYERSPSSATLRNRIMGQIEKYDLQKRLIEAIRPKYRMPLEIGYATGYAKHLIFGTPEPKTTSLPKDRAEQVRHYVRVKFDEIS